MKNKPIYGSIAYTGDEWTVQFKADKWTHNHYLRGCGTFPYERYPNIPVIDYSKGTMQSALQSTRINLPKETDPVFGNGTINEYLEQIKKLDIPIHNYQGE